MINYILKTLQQEDHVFIERLGAFRTQLKHAVIENNVIHPPYYEVVFSQKDSEENNFALANQISRDKQCLFTEANEQITAWVDELLVALQHNKSVTYEDFGTFMLDKKGNVSFESSVIPQLNSQFEGMESIAIGNVAAAALDSVSEIETEDDETMKVEESVQEPEPVGANNDSPDDEAMKDDETMKVEESVQEPEPVGANNDSPDDEAMKDDETMKVEESVQDPEPVGANNDSPDDEAMKVDDDDDDDDDEDDDDEEKHHGLAWLWVLLLLLLALGALGYVFKDRIWNCYHQWKDRKHPVEQKVVLETTATEDQTAVFEEEPVVEEGAVVEEETPEVVEETVPEPVAPAPVKATSDGKYNYVRYEQGRYYVIVGSLPTESDAEQHIRNKKLDQYSPVIVRQEGVKNLRVCIGVFDTEAEAERFAKNTNQSYWVLK